MIAHTARYISRFHDSCKSNIEFSIQSRKVIEHVKSVTFEYPRQLQCCLICMQLTRLWNSNNVCQYFCKQPSELKQHLAIICRGHSFIRADKWRFPMGLKKQMLTNTQTCQFKARIYCRIVCVYASYFHFHLGDSCKR